MKKITSNLIVLFIGLLLIGVGLFYYYIKPTQCLAAHNSLDVPYASQKTGSNCGSACMEMVLKHESINVNQCQIDARFVDKKNPCKSLPCDCQDPSNCTKPSGYFIQDIQSTLDTAFNLNSKIIYTSKITPDSIQNIITTEVDAKRPIIAFGDVMIYNKNTTPIIQTNNPHFVVITGYEKDNQCNFFYNIYDPYKCPDTCKYKIPLNSMMFSPEQLLINIRKK